MEIQKSITKPTVMAGKNKYSKKAVSTPKNIPNQGPLLSTTPTKPIIPIVDTPQDSPLNVLITKAANAVTARRNKEQQVVDLLHSIALHPSPLLNSTEKETWTNHYLEVPMPEEWLERPVLIGTNLMNLRGVVMFDPIITEIKTRDKQEKLLLGKFLLRVWNQLISPSAPEGYTQTNVSTIYATGFEAIAEAIRGLKSGDHVMVRGYLNSRKYERTFEGNAENITATCYDTSVTIKSLIKFVSTPPNALEDDFVLPSIPYETQDIV